MKGRVVNVRRLVALDITLHGPGFIMIEFGVGTPPIILFGLFLGYVGMLGWGAYLLLCGINYRSWRTPW